MRNVSTRHPAYRARRLRLGRIAVHCVAALVLVFADAGSEADAAPAPCDTASRCREALRLETGGTIPFFRSHRLLPDPRIRRAVIVVQGNRRDADHYFDALVSAARLEGSVHPLAPKTLLLAPNYRILGDQPDKTEHYWSSHGWKEGNKSLDPTRVSSFSVMDNFVTRICSNEPKLFPNLETLVIVGHSAGGQFVNRYAAGGVACTTENVEMRYVVMNPSSYLYVDERRKTETGIFEAPGRGCRKYNEYKYGLKDLNTYMRRVGTKKLRAQLATRKTYYVAGEKDDRKGSSLDTRCQANLQGPNRLARHANYRDYVRLFKYWTGAAFSTVPNIGHKGDQMLRSEPVRKIMFR